MLSWFSANLGTIVITLLLMGMVGLIVRSMIRDRKAGKSTCGGNCSHCKGCH